MIPINQQLFSEMNKKINDINTKILNIKLFENSIINGACRIAQKIDDTINISTSYQVGQVDMYAAKYEDGGISITNGTIEQGTNLQAIGGKSVKVDSITSSGSGSSGKVYIANRIESKNTYIYKDKNIISFSCSVMGSYTSVKNVEIKINTPTATDDYTSKINVYSKIFESLNLTTKQELKIENIEFISNNKTTNPENGIEIEVIFYIDEASSGESLEVFDWYCIPFPKIFKLGLNDYGQELQKCKRYYNRLWGDTVYYEYGLTYNTATITTYAHIRLDCELRISITDANFEHDTTFTNYDLVGGGNVTNMVVDTNNSTKRCAVIAVTTSGIIAGGLDWLRNNNNTTAFMGFYAGLF